MEYAVGVYLVPAESFVHQFEAAALVVPIVDTFKCRLLLSALSISTGDRRPSTTADSRQPMSGQQPAYNIFITFLIVFVDCVNRANSDVPSI